MIDIVQKIDNWTATQYPELNKNLFGYCELMRKTTGSPPSEQPMPVKIIDKSADRGHRAQVSLDDKYQLITWVRLIGNLGIVENEDDQWGLKDGRRQSVELRWVIAHKVELGENFIRNLIHAFPDRFTISGYSLTFVDRDISTDTNHEEIYRTELGNTVYEKHRFNWNLYAITLNVEYLICV